MEHIKLGYSGRLLLLYLLLGNPTLTPYINLLNRVDLLKFELAGRSIKYRDCKSLKNLLFIGASLIISLSCLCFHIRKLSLNPLQSFVKFPSNYYTAKVIYVHHECILIHFLHIPRMLLKGTCHHVPLWKKHMNLTWAKSRVIQNEKHVRAYVTFRTGNGQSYAE